MRSEGDVIVRDALVSVVRCIGGGGRLSWAGGPVAAALTAARLAEEREFVDQNLGLVTLCARLLVVPRARLDLALDEELSALLHVVADDLRGTLERDQIVPFGLIDPVACASFARSAVARVKLAMVMPPLVVRISGSLPTWPRRKTLLTPFAIVVSPSWEC